MQLVCPAAEHLPSYRAALLQGWSAGGRPEPEAAAKELARLNADPAEFLAGTVDREGKGRPVELPDGTQAKRLPGFQRWIWDGAFCGVISFRWQIGTEALPPHCLGHIGYGVVPEKRRLGYATQALAQMLPLARAEGLRYVEITTDPSNVASQRVIEANGGVLHERFIKPPQFGSIEGLRYRVYFE